MYSRMGVDPSKPKIQQLRILLSRLHPQSDFEELLQTLRDLRATYLDDKLIAAVQQSSLREIEKELKEIFQNYFNHYDPINSKEEEKILFHSIRVVYELHNQRRKAMQKRKIREQNRQMKIVQKKQMLGERGSIQTREDIDLTLPNSHSGEGLDVNKNRSKKEQISVASCSSHERSKSINGRLNNDQPRLEHQFPASSPLTSKLTKRSTTSGVNITNDGGFDYIGKFLKGCSPNMEHLLGNFIQYGCNSEEFLRILSFWPEDYRKHALREILSGTDGDRINNMEMAILEFQLDLHFKRV